MKNKIQEETTDNTLKDLENIQDFLYRNFKDSDKYDDKRPVEQSTG